MDVKRLFNPYQTAIMLSRYNRQYAYRSICHKLIHFMEISPAFCYLPQINEKPVSNNCSPKFTPEHPDFPGVMKCNSFS